MLQVAEYIKCLQSSIFTHSAVYSYIIMHMTISAVGVFVNTFRFPDDIAWVNTSMCENMRSKQETSCFADRSDIGRWRSGTCCVMLYQKMVMGRGRDWLSTHVWLLIERSWYVPITLRRACQTPKKRI